MLDWVTRALNESLLILSRAAILPPRMPATPSPSSLGFLGRRLRSPRLQRCDEPASGRLPHSGLATGRHLLLPFLTQLSTSCHGPTFGLCLGGFGRLVGTP